MINIPFGNLLLRIIDNRGKTCPTSDRGIPLIATNCIKNENLYPIYEKVRYVSKEIYDTWFRGHPEPGDLIFVLKGTPGRVNWVKDPVDFCIAQDMVALRVDRSKVYPKYLFAVLRSSQIQQEIEGLHVGSLIPHFKKSDFDDLEIPLVNEKLQKYIGDMYFNLSMKIDLLYRQNETLEALAETLFRQWFIEEVNENWKVGTLEHLIDLKYGKALKQENRSGSGYPVVASSGVVGFHNEYLVEGPGIVIGRKGTLGKVYFMEDNFYPIDTSYFIKTKIPESNLLFEYYLLKSLDFVNMNSDSAVPGLNRNLALGTTIQIPPLKRIVEFNTLAKPWFSKIYTNTKQIQTLEKLRDTLLPKVMSGEVRVEYERVYAA
ncbi:restriction endonuclease subunit S [Acinetobacter baumannii]|nr:restriction endonuclease subunit S [Acinetobacter baumannii]